MSLPKSLHAGLDNLFRGGDKFLCGFGQIGKIFYGLFNYFEASLKFFISDDEGRGDANDACSAGFELHDS